MENPRIAKLLKIKPEAGLENVKGKQIKSDFGKKMGWDWLKSQDKLFTVILKEPRQSALPHLE